MKSTSSTDNIELSELIKQHTRFVKSDDRRYIIKQKKYHDKNLKKNIAILIAKIKSPADFRYTGDLRYTGDKN